MISELQVVAEKPCLLEKSGVVRRSISKNTEMEQRKRCKVFSLQMYFFYHYMNFLSFLKLKVIFTQKSHQILILTLVTPEKIS